MYEYAKSVDPSRLIHYEGDAEAVSADMFSYMYPPIDVLIKHAETTGVSNGSFEKPIVLCEYAHAMGNGPGGLEDYQAAFRLDHVTASYKIESFGNSRKILKSGYLLLPDILPGKSSSIPLPSALSQKGKTEEQWITVIFQQKFPTAWADAAHELAWMQQQLSSPNVETSEYQVTFTAKTFISPPILNWGFESTITYQISSTGSLKIKVHLKPTGSMPSNLPRVGLDIKLRDDFDNAEWFGIGPGESYVDKCSSQKLGIYSADVDQLHTPYDVPQENGNRTSTRWVKMTDSSGVGVRASSSGNPTTFQWAATRYSTAALQKARHPRDLIKEKNVLWRLDAEAAGVGSAACGPGVKEEFQVKCDEKEFEFIFENIDI
ncbi:hypothetical protein DID88_001672 [Monilinia fructigena]|uniref:Beta galactosidase small chain/ domain-containing protein n=1 Tax=Monilinia fructigena TaxID=38457 RepID=A0A395J1V9_9HELO|nr:hypothetical protein DID88_001672 [Monilinia fructigena]